MKKDDFLLKTSDEEKLEELLRLVQKRLGTCEERRDDFDLAQSIAHQLNNLWTVARLREAVSRCELSS